MANRRISVGMRHGGVGSCKAAAARGIACAMRRVRVDEPAWLHDEVYKEHLSGEMDIRARLG